jgi:hypothetical protein
MTDLHIAVIAIALVIAFSGYYLLCERVRR